MHNLKLLHISNIFIIIYKNVHINYHNYYILQFNLPYNDSNNKLLYSPYSKHNYNEQCQLPFLALALAQFSMRVTRNNSKSQSCMASICQAMYKIINNKYPKWVSLKIRKHFPVLTYSEISQQHNKHTDLHEIKAYLQWM